MTGKTDLPDLNSILFLIGIQELGQVRTKFSKEEKQDLMHIAVCVLLSEDGYFEFKGQDTDGWPHFEQVRPLDVLGPDKQESLLKKRIVLYFAPHLAGATNH